MLKWYHGTSSEGPSITFKSGESTVKSADVHGRHHPNTVRTTRFTWVTLIPLSLYYQFQRRANQYFAIVSVLSFVLEYFSMSPKSALTTFTPFMVVLWWTAMKDWAQDRTRKRDDKLENNRPVAAWRNG